MTMKQDLMKRLLQGWTSPLDALMCCDCLSLAQRVSEWRFQRKATVGTSLTRPPLIIDRWVTTPSGKRFKEYRAIK